MDYLKERFKMMVGPPFSGPEISSREHIETASESLIYCLRVSFLHFGHQQLLTGRAHGYEYNIGVLLGNVGKKCLLFFLIVNETVAASGYVYVRVLLLQLGNHLLIDILSSANNIK